MLDVCSQDENTIVPELTNPYTLVPCVVRSVGWSWCTLSPVLIDGKFGRAKCCFCLPKLPTTEHSFSFSRSIVKHLSHLGVRLARTTWVHGTLDLGGQLRSSKCSTMIRLGRPKICFDVPKTLRWYIYV